MGINKFLAHTLPRVKKPSRYTGGEWNSIVKAGGEERLSFLLAYPDAYEVGIANLGIQILYQTLNERDDVRAERAFAPWLDMEQEMRNAGVSPFSLETRSPIASFDVIGFSLQHELNYSNALNMLDLAHIPLLSQERQEVFPLVCGGGPCTVNPEPLADFFDFFFLGEAEEAILELVDVIWQAKKEHPKCSAGLPPCPSPSPLVGEGRGGRSSSVHPLPGPPPSRGRERSGRPKGLRYKRELLLRLAQIPGVYVPQFYAARYDAAGRFVGTFPGEKEVPPIIQRRVVKDLDSVSLGQRPVVPFAEAAQEHLSLEIARGCPHGCRFCQAGYTIRPYRHRSAEVVVRAAQEGLGSTGLDTLSLLALNCPDHPRLEEIVSLLAPRLTAAQVGLSFPSSRVDSFPLALAASAPGKRTGLTLAPEAASDRLRTVIRKRVSRQQLLNLARSAYRAGWNSIKLYYMLGLPTETDDDLRAIGEEVREVLAQPRGRAKVNVSLSTFIPKPHTPFQWERQEDVLEVEGRQHTALAGLRDRRIRVSWHDSRQSLLEGALARGDRSLGKALLAAQALHLRMDAWSEAFDWEGWQQAFAQAGIDPRRYLRPRQEDEPLPWDHLHCGIAKSRLLDERRRAFSPTAPATPVTSCQWPVTSNQGSLRSALCTPHSALPTYSLLLFGKLGDLRFLSPLEVQAALIRGLRRSALPLAFSSGFHPRPRVSFGRALRVGTESDVLLAIISLTEEMRPQEVKARLERSLPAAMPLRAVKTLDQEKKKAALHSDWETALVQVQPGQPVNDSVQQEDARPTAGHSAGGRGSAFSLGGLDDAVAAFLRQPTIPVARRPRQLETRNLKSVQTRPEKRTDRLETEVFDAKSQIRNLQVVKVAPQSGNASLCTLHPALCTFWLKVSLGRGIPALSPEDLVAALLQHLGGGDILHVRQISFGRTIAAKGSPNHPVGEALCPSTPRQARGRERS